VGVELADDGQERGEIGERGGSSDERGHGMRVWDGGKFVERFMAAGSKVYGGEASNAQR
jgi:hypothetical protein